MISWILISGWIFFIVAALAALIFIITSLFEGRFRAAKIAGLIFTPSLLLWVLLLIIDLPGRPWIVLGVLVISLGAVLLVTLPRTTNIGIAIAGEQRRVDERDIIFTRFYRIKPGTDEFKQFYQEHPDKFDVDEKTRQLPQLGAPNSKSYHPLSSPYAVAAFEVLERITRQIDWDPDPLEPKAVQASPEEFTRCIKGFAGYLGAKKVGITQLNPAYVYSHIGRSPGPWGQPIELNHTQAIAICVEMNHQMIRHAPDSPTITETGYKYFEAGKIALLLARYINLLGYRARAHLDGYYRVMCVPLAAEAGLGELGRLGLLITPEYGPRIRLSAVTTDLPLVNDQPIVFGVQDFCELCKKCSDNCPSNSISANGKELYQGVKKWQTNQDTCYRFWRTQGTDCAICVKVCPYSHPGSPMHELIRRLVRRNHRARLWALRGDDLFYGRRPKITSAVPDWHD